MTMWPGEALLIKLWETLAEKGVGGLLKPWQGKREAKAQIESRRLELVALADAEREAAEIRAGRLRITDSRYIVGLPAPELSDRRCLEAATDSRPALEIVNAAVIGEALRREVNTAKAIAFAEEQLKSDTRTPPDQKIESDWLFRWRDHAGTVSADELQTIWGRLLAGELRTPGFYSLRTLDFVKNLSTEEAKLIEALARFVVSDFIAKNHQAILEAEGVKFRDLLEMQNLGIISGVDAFGLNVTLRSTEQNRFFKPLCSHGRVLVVSHMDPTKEFTLEAYMVTALGRQVMSLGEFSPVDSYLRAIGETLKSAGAEVSMGSYQGSGRDRISIVNSQLL